VNNIANRSAASASHLASAVLYYFVAYAGGTQTSQEHSGALPWINDFPRRDYAIIKVSGESESIPRRRHRLSEGNCAGR
jgi:hypothetical protein